MDIPRGMMATRAGSLGFPRSRVHSQYYLLILTSPCARSLLSMAIFPPSRAHIPSSPHISSQVRVHILSDVWNRRETEYLPSSDYVQLCVRLLDPRTFFPTSGVRQVYYYE